MENKEFNHNIYPNEIVDALVNMSSLNIDANAKAGLIDIVYDLLAIVENPYNRDGFRNLYQVLENIAENYQLGNYDKA